MPGCNGPVISGARYDAVIFDLDGVVTKTMSTHAAAWKEVFDAFLAHYASANPAAPKEASAPFGIETDYMIYVDGKPRLEGIRSFLRSRGIELPEGRPQDPPGFDSVHALGILKNRRFLEQVKKHGVEVYGATLDFIRKLRAQGIRTAIISSSKNCALILDSSGISEMFEVRVDGIDLQKRNIPGKPAPDMFLDAAARLGVSPERTAAVEDAVSGVQAARAGGFGLVIGIARLDNREDLLRYGAHVVVSDASEISVAEAVRAARPAPVLPSALDGFAEIAELAAKRRPAVFLDYDGTLTPIVDTPDKALLGGEMRRVLIDLSRACPVGILSGRDMSNVMGLVQVDSLIYAGSHGFEIIGPGGMRADSKGGTFLPALDGAERELREKVDGVGGVLVERKKYAIAVHYRLSDPADVPEIEHAVDEVASRRRELRKAFGKKVFELQPNIDWNKGKALLFLLGELGLDRDDVLPIYIGDDVTDEDAFRVLKGQGIGIVVWDGPYPTAATRSLKNTDEVREFLSRLIPLCGGAHEQ
jgi:trehalose 6-phosphate phosphatase